jgi:beta-1,4-N-acetylglucosaminyltransferase
MTSISHRKIDYVHNVLITVGTTEFDELIDYLDMHCDSFITSLQAIGCKSLRVQIGRGNTYPSRLQSCCEKYKLRVDIFRFKPTIDEEMRAADLIITHCGAGSIIESLSLEKLFIVVINRTLQGNHQMELANALTAEEYCTAAYPTDLISEIQHIQRKLQESNLLVKIYPKANHELFPALIDSLFSI